jgi:glyoxylase-like metal-dependent hydrolase (beta-lactamase superfamily II)
MIAGTEPPVGGGAISGGSDYGGGAVVGHGIAAERVIPLLDGVIEFDPVVAFPQTSASDWDCHGEFLHSPSKLVMPYGGFLVTDSSGARILVDVGGGPSFQVPADMGRLPKSGGLPGALTRLGVAPVSIDAIVLTHLHPDHIGWLAPDGVPFFPRADIYCHRADWAYFVDTPAPPDPDIPDRLAGCESRLTLWEGERASVGDLVMRHVPGHTPGSCVVTVPGAGGPAAVIGDLVHSPVEFLERWDGLADVDPAMAVTARHAVKAEFAAARTIVWGTHFPSMAPGILGEGSGQGTTWTRCC